MGKIRKSNFSKRLNNEKLDSEFRKARLDVFKFGVKHLNKKDKEATKIDQLIRLGAKPKRNSYENYRQLICDKKKSKIKDLTSDETLKKHLSMELKKQIDIARSKYDKKRSNKKKISKDGKKSKK